MNPFAFSSEKIESRQTSDRGREVFCILHIAKGEVVAIFGGKVLSLDSALLLNAEDKSQCLQIEEQYVIWTAANYQSTADWINHSCEPNLGLSSSITLVALRDISVGEVVCYDYAMSDGSSIDEFPCMCGAQSCRKQISGLDWMNPSLQKSYEGYFSPYLNRRIKQKTATLSESRFV